MTGTRSDAALTEIAVSSDELEFLRLLRSMKHGSSVEVGDDVARPPPSGQPAGAIAPFDQALVIAHHAATDHLQLGLLRLPAEGAEDARSLPTALPVDYGTVEECWSRLTGEAGTMKHLRETDFLRDGIARLREARAVHERAREVIARFDETSSKADEVSRRTKDILARGKSQSR